MLTIYGSDLSSPANKVRYAANALGLKHEYRRINLRDGEQKTADFLKKHPAGKIPVIDDDGFVLFESNAIIRYLADKNNSPLYPKEIRARAVVEQWIDFGTMHIGVNFSKVAFNRIFAPRMGKPVDESSLKDGLAFLAQFLPVVDAELAKHKFIAGSAMTLADINLLALLDPAEIAQVDLSPYVHIVAWRNNLKAQPFYTQCHKEYGEALRPVAKQ